MTPGPHAQQSTTRRDWIGPAACILIVLLSNTQLLVHLSTHVAGGAGDDVFAGLWQLDWIRKALFELWVDPLYCPDVLFPHGLYLASTPEPTWYLFALAPIAQVLGTVATYNLALLGAMCLGAVMTYVLAGRYSQHRLPRIIAAIGYVSAPVLTIRMGGHLNILLGMAWLPGALWAAGEAIDSPTHSRRWSILCGLFLSLSILGCWYYLFITTIPLVIYFLCYRSSDHYANRLLKGFLIAATCAFIVAPFAYMTLSARSRTYSQGGRFCLQESDSFSLSPDRLLYPNPVNGIWGLKSQSRFPLTGEQDFVSLGYSLSTLALLGMFAARHRQKRALWWGAAIALVLAMGTTLHWNTHRVQLPAAGGPFGTWTDALDSTDLSAMSESGRVAVPLPGLLLGLYLPFYDSMRVWARYCIPLQLIVALFGTLGSELLHRRYKGAKVLLGVALLLVAVEGWTMPYHSFTSVASNARPLLSRWLKAEQSESVVIEYPRHLSFDTVPMYCQGEHSLATANGYLPTPPNYLLTVDTQLGDLPSETSIPVLQRWGTDLLLLSTDESWESQAALDAAKQLTGLQYLRAFDEGYGRYTKTHVFTITGAAPDKAYLDSGFEWLPPGTPSLPRWTTGDASLSFFWPEQSPSTPATCCLQLQIAAGRPIDDLPCQVSVTVEDVLAFEGALPEGPRPVSVVIPLADLENTDLDDLQIVLSSTTWVPAELTDSPDTRTLGIMLFDATISNDLESCYPGIY